MVSFLNLVIGFAFLVWGADRFVEGSSALAQKMGIPSLIVGLTIVAFGTSAPELAVSVSASLADANEIALGNVLGSNIFNLLFVGGLCAMIAPLVVEADSLKRDWVASLCATLLLFILLVMDNDISRFDAIILLGAFAFIMFLQIRFAVQNKVQSVVSDGIFDSQPDTLSHPELKNDVQNTPSSLLSGKIAFSILVGLFCIIAGGQLSVSGATDLARIFGLSETVIGLTIVAIGTSLPELVTSLIATRRGENSIAIGNIIGSNIFNILFILGVSCLINPISIQITAFLDTIILFIVTFWVFMLAKRGTLNLQWGMIMTSAYLWYFAWLFIR